MLRLAPPLAVVILIGPIIFGLLATLLPAFGYFPALGGHEFGLQYFHELAARPGIFRSSMISLWTGLGTTLIALSIVMVFVAGWSGSRSFTRVQHLVSPLLSVPHAAAAFGLAFLIAPSGWIIRLISPALTGFDRPPDVLIINDPWGIVLTAGLVAKEIPFLLLVTLAALPQTDARRNSHVVTSLGYGRVWGFLVVVWPRIYSQIRLAVYAVISYASSVVDVSLILGPTRPASLSVRLLGWMNDPEIALRFEASAAAILQLAITLAALLIWYGGERLCGYTMRCIARTGFRGRADALVRNAGMGLMSLSALSIFLGLLVLAIWSIAGFWAFPDALPRSFNFNTWSRALPGLDRPFWNTISTGVVATGLAIAIALACLEREARVGRTGGSKALLLLYIPLLVPQTGFVFGLQVFFLTLGWDATFAALVFVHLIFVLPYVFLSISDPWRAWDKRYASVAHGLGASDNRIFWRIRTPMLLRAILTATAVGFAVSIGQYLPTISIGAGRLPTITTEAVALASGGDRRIIGVYAFFQMMLPFAAFLLATLVPAVLFRNRRDLKASA